MATVDGNSEAGGGHEIVHHYSPYPLLIGLGALVTYFGLAYLNTEPARDASAAAQALADYGQYAIVPGVLILLYAFLGWVREDAHFWKTGWEVPGVRPGGKHVGWWGLMFFLGTEVMLFGGLFAAYFAMRAARPEDFTFDLPVGLVAINTLILISSGATMHYALHAIQQDNRKGFIGGLVATLILGGIFLAGQVYEYFELIHHGFTLSSSAFAGIFYILTGTHGFHVFLGLVFIAIALVRGLKGQFDAKRHLAVDAFAIYWHFVDIVWIFLFLTIYLGVI